VILAGARKCARLNQTMLALSSLHRVWFSIVLWQPRFAVLTADQIVFTKHFQEVSRNLGSHSADVAADLDLSSNELWEVFECNDKDRNG